MRKALRSQYRLCDRSMKSRLCNQFKQRDRIRKNKSPRQPKRSCGKPYRLCSYRWSRCSSSRAFTESNISQAEGVLLF